MRFSVMAGMGWVLLALALVQIIYEAAKQGPWS